MSIPIRFKLALAAAMIFASPSLAHAAPDTADDPDLAQYRERFKQGLDRLNDANDVAGALSYWEPLYRDLGPARGYRVGYNLARAYEVFGDATRAAERYQSFLDEVKQRRVDGKPIDDVVASDEQKATARLEELARTRGRIHVVPTTPPESVRIDQAEPRLAGFVAYVAPGAHDVVFAPGSDAAQVQHVDVQAGQIIDVAPEKKSSTTIATPPPIFVDTVKRPFSPVWIAIATGATVLIGGGLTTAAYANAIAAYDGGAGNGADYYPARTLAYASWTAPATLAAITLGLILIYVGATKHVKVTTALAF